MQAMDSNSMQSKEMTKEEKLLNDLLYEQPLHFPIKYSKSLNIVKKPHITRELAFNNH
jgi:hypothetical protein